MKETIAKINITKRWFFEKINKIDKPLASLNKKNIEQTPNFIPKATGKRRTKKPQN